MGTALAAEALSAFLLLSFYATLVSTKYIKYNTGAAIVPGKLNVHLVPHSHDDVGWLKTVDQYYVGSNNSIQVRIMSFFCVRFEHIIVKLVGLDRCLIKQGACVENVLDSVVVSLQKDPNRKFVFAEMVKRNIS